MSYPAEFGGSYAIGARSFEYTQNLEAIRRAREENLGGVTEGRYHQG